MALSSSFFLNPHKHLLFVPLKIVIMIVMRWNLSDVWICIYFMAKDVEYFFMYLLTICTSFSEKFNFLAYLLIGLFVLLAFSCLSSLYILDINPSPEWTTEKISFHSVDFLLILVFVLCEVFKFMQCHFSIIFWVTGILLRKALLMLISFIYLFIYLLFIYSHVHTLFGLFLPRPLSPPSPLTPPLLTGRTCSALFSSSVEE
jgi:hypothetical protein